MHFYLFLKIFIVYSKGRENILLVFTLFRHFGANKSTLFVENAKMLNVKMFFFLQKFIKPK